MPSRQNKGADDEMVLEKEVDNTEKSLCLQLEDTIVFPESSNSPDAEDIQEDIANKIHKADVAKETNDQVSKEVNNKEAEDCLNISDSNMNMNKVSNKVGEEEVENAEESVSPVLEDTIFLPIYVQKRIEESSIKDIDGLSTRKGKCQRMIGCNINLRKKNIYIYIIIYLLLPLYIVY